MGKTTPFNTLSEMFDVITKQYQNSEKPVIMRKVNNKYENISYAEYRSYVTKFMLGMHSIGLEAGDKVAIISENRPEWMISDMGLICLGAIDVPVYPSLTAKQLEFIFIDAEIKYVIISNQ